MQLLVPLIGLSVIYLEIVNVAAGGFFSYPKPAAPPSTPEIKSEDVLKDWFANESKKVIGYVTNWSQYRGTHNNPQCRKYAKTLGTVDSTLYTHLIYSFLTVKPDYTVSITGDDQNLKEMVKEAKKKNPKVKILFALGGWTFNEVDATKGIFSAMVSSQKNINRFIASVRSTALKYGFDGLDLDWEYPGSPGRGGNEKDHGYLVTLFKSFREKLAGSEFLLSIASPIGDQAEGYHFEELAKYLDFINIMAYDIHGSWESKVNHNAPLNAPENEMSVSSFFSKYYESKRIPREKLILGMPLYGVAWTVAVNSSVVTSVPPIGTTAKPGVLGECTLNQGTLAIHEIMDMLNGKEPSVIENSDFGTSALVGNQWIAFDDENVIKKKIKFLKQKKLGGVMMWSVDQDTLNYDSTKLMIQLLK